MYWTILLDMTQLQIGIDEFSVQPRSCSKKNNLMFGHLIRFGEMGCEF